MPPLLGTDTVPTNTPGVGAAIPFAGPIITGGQMLFGPSSSQAMNNAYVQQIQNRFQNDVLAPISASFGGDPATQEASRVKLASAWDKFLSDSQTFIDQAGPNSGLAASSVRQALTTPSFINTVAGLLGENPLGAQYASKVKSASGGGTPQWLSDVIATVPSILQTIALPRSPQVPGVTTPVNPGTPVATQPSGIGGGVIDPATTPNTIRGPADPGQPTHVPTPAPFPTPSNGAPDDPNNPNNPNLIFLPSDPTTLPRTPQVPGATVPTSPGTPTGNVNTNTNTVTVNTPANPPTDFSWLKDLVPGIISGATGLLGAVMTGNNAEAAARIQAEAANRAADLQKQAADAALGLGKDSLQFNKDVFTQQQANIQPWLTAGGTALSQLGGLTGANAPTWDKQFVQPDLNNTTDPGFQARLDQGNKAVQRAEAAIGTLRSGGGAKALVDYNQNQTSNEYQNVYARAKDDYNTAYNTFANERSAKLNPLLALAGLGQTGVAQMGAAGANAVVANSAINANQGNIITNTAGNVGNLNQGAAQATAAGGLASGNALAQAIAQIGNNAASLYSMNNLIRR